MHLAGPPHLVLLPLYLQLYDETVPELLPRQERFLARVASLMRSQGLSVTLLPICRTRPQVGAAVASAEEQRADGIVAIHLAYSPSLEAAGPLSATSLPLLLLDTTPAESFGPAATMDDVLENHGVHGVQDLASVLLRQGREYSVIAGAIGDPRLAGAFSNWARAARARAVARTMVVARVGAPFPGMGDFDVSDDWLCRVIGPRVAPLEVAHIAEVARGVTAADLAAEREADRAAFDCGACPDDCWERSNRLGLALRQALAEAGAGAFSMNFAAFERAVGASTVPFLEASKAMARGLGYAGEGDVLTASLVAALNSCYAPTTFTEMFCPDWSGGRIFMSHMGECNPALAKRRPRLVEKQYAFGPVDNPAVLIFPLRPGPAGLVNLAPRSGEQAALISIEVTVEDMEPAPGLLEIPHFWIAPPRGEVAGFLERYSEAGGTHHLALTPGLSAADLRPLAKLMGWEFVLLE